MTILPSVMLVGWLQSTIFLVFLLPSFTLVKVINPLLFMIQVTPTRPTPTKRLQHLKPVSRQEAYKADITYGTNNEFGFDYLRDNMARGLENQVQRFHHFAYC